jgi:haloacid dehalogenase-like hydrolase
VIPRRIVVRRTQLFLLLLVILISQLVLAQATDPLPSWNDNDTKKAILAFVQRTTSPGTDFVPPDQRIATFDNDGTLWVEQPLYTQLVFALDRVKALAPKHPEWKTQQPFKAVLEGNTKAFLATGQAGLLKVIAASHAGMTNEQFEKIVSDWIATANHPRFKRPYTECVYQPMLELMAYLRANGFRVYIVSGGGIEFMRPWAPKVYGVPTERVIGSAAKTRYQIIDGKPELMRLPEILFVDDGPGKPEAINLFIGRRPIAAVGNSDGDQQMLEWTAANQGKPLLMLIHHTDADREYAYDRNSHVGKLDKALDEANAKGWVVVDMKRDWKVIFPPVSR